MNKVLIHSNNTSLNQQKYFSVEDQYFFDVPFDVGDIDVFIDQELNSGKLKELLMPADVAFIKVSLSDNYLEYLGIRLAYHIRLTKSLGEKTCIPMVFIGEESLQFLGITAIEPSILFTGGIYLIKEHVDDYNRVINWYDEGYIKPLQNFTNFINSIKIQPPANYQSHHSIANEWALIRYFSMLEKDETNEVYSDLQSKIENLDYPKTLHFKYLEAKASRQKFNSKKHGYTPKIAGIENIKVGIIDDEISKGWLCFYNYLFAKSKGMSVAYEGFKKDESREELIIRIQKWLGEIFQSSQPIDIFIIDIRLHDDDFVESDFDSLSGIQVIKFIKSKNRGIQIVVSTASNKVWNYQRCLDHGTSHFAVKESPETYSSREETRLSLVHLSKQITDAADKAFVAGVFRDIEKLKGENLFRESTVETFYGTTFEKNGLLDQIANLLILDCKNDAILNQCVLIAFQILENYCDLQSVGIFDFKNSSGKVCQLGTGNLIDIFTLSHDNTQILTKLELVKGRLSFQAESCRDTITSFEISGSRKLLSSFSSGIDTTSLVKIISILHFRHSIFKPEIERVIRLRYYRSNVAAHLTGCVKSEFKIKSEEIVFLISIFKKIFL